MLPIVLDPTAIRIGVAGRGDGLKRRLGLLEEAGAEKVAVFDQSIPAGQLAQLSVLFVAGLDSDQSRELAAAAQAARVLVNVEDQPDLCDFHVPASLRRGDLLFTVSTGGHSPGLSRLLREELERSKSLIEAQAGETVSYIAYPIGGHSPRVTAAARRCYDAGFAVEDGLVELVRLNDEDYRFRIPRVNVHDADPRELFFRINGFHKAARRLMRPGSRAATRPAS